LGRFSHHLRTGLEGKTDAGRDFFYSFVGKGLWESKRGGRTTFFDQIAHLRPIVEGRIAAPASPPIGVCDRGRPIAD
jgi:hypothetical protein